MNDRSPPMKWQQRGGGFCMVQFERDVVHAIGASEREGRPIFDEVLRVYITPPGTGGAPNQVTTRELERKYHQGDDKPPMVKRHPSYDEFRPMIDKWDAGQTDSMTGTPLRELHALDRATVASLKAMGIHTVEELANISDGNLGMGMRKWRTQARAYLEQAAGQQPVAKLAAELERAKAEIDALKAQIAATPVAAADDADEAPRPRRGRPPRQHDEAA